ncbi:Phosphotransferase involved in threonylcarbamoyladenosine t(6)A37 formation in tRNA [hydrothermal vent metagenome]|uniref:Phosphotransferase involved in threonylcarbamoyladenosine t(6)A37 formation in tRNA n=1 Tax=hydrothermal vent metagenome TaxID=652676 RepID=A0A3B1AB66_9ZZZZ
MKDSRLDLLEKWLTRHLELSHFELTAASSDASFRRYFRVSNKQQSYIAMDAPPEKENSKPFVAIAKLLFEAGINVPEIFQADFEKGFFLISDLGNEQYLTALNSNSVENLYQTAIKKLIELQLIEKDKLTNIPEYDNKLLILEMELFRDWYLKRHLSIELNATQNNLISTVFNLLAASAQVQKKVLVHRDYHSRNLMTNDSNSNNPGVLDFQDAVIGPFSYDLVSLLRDCYISWPEWQVEKLALYYKHLAEQQNIIPQINDNDFIKYFDLMGIQRHLKAVGIFSRLNYRDNKPAYLNDIPRTLTYIKNISNKYDELIDFNVFLNSELNIV